MFSLVLCSVLLIIMLEGIIMKAYVEACWKNIDSSLACDSRGTRKQEKATFFEKHWEKGPCVIKAKGSQRLPFFEVRRRSAPRRWWLNYTLARELHTQDVDE